MFPKPTSATIIDRGAAGWTMINVPSFHCDPARDGTLTERAVIMDLKQQASAWWSAEPTTAGVVKKTMFTVMNFALPGARSAHHALLGERR